MTGIGQESKGAYAATKRLLRALLTPFSRQHGMTLIGVAAAAGLLGVVGTGLIAAIILGLRGTDNVDQRSIALQLARSQVEAIKAEPYAEPVSYTALTPPSTDFQISISGTTLTPGFLQQVTVSITHPEGAVQLSFYKYNDAPPVTALWVGATSTPVLLARRRDPLRSRCLFRVRDCWGR